jgi:hypothetical protein
VSAGTPGTCPQTRSVILTHGSVLFNALIPYIGLLLNQSPQRSGRRTLAIIDINLDIGDTIRAIDEILARGQTRQETAWEFLADQLEAVAKTVSDLDTMYLRLLGEIEDILMHSPLSRDRLDAAIQQIRTYRTDERLFGRLSEWRGIVEAAAFQPALKHRKYRSLASTLLSIDHALGIYIDRLGRVQAGETDHGRPDLSGMQVQLEAIAVELDSDERSGELLSEARESCEQAIRTYTRALASALAQLIGNARGDIALAHL